MKKFLKFFPVALAAFALASCSSDDLNVAGEGEIAFSPDKLLVQIEGDGSDEATRGGYVTNIYNYNLYSALAFDAGDALKVYHNATSWRPEVWTADAYDQYKNANGTSVFKLAGSTIKKEEDAYAIYPSTASVFGNENRTSIHYDLSDLAFVKYGIDDSKEYEGTTGDGAITKYYQAKFPLWGVKQAGAEVMTMKHLAGILRLDIADVTFGGTSPLPTAANEYKYVIIYSATKKLTGEIKTAANLLVPTSNEALVPESFMTATPKLEVEATTNDTFNENAIPLDEASVKDVDNVIVIRIDKNTTDKHLFAFVPILPETAADDINVCVTNTLSSSVTTVDATALPATQKYKLTADIINECNNAYKAGGQTPYAGETTVQRGVTYKINDDSTNKNTTATTPFELAKGIIEADQAAYRDFEITFTKPIEVKNTGVSNPQNYYIDLTNSVADYRMTELVGTDGWVLKHNVTVNLTLKESDDAGGTSTLYIKTNAGDKTLTLNISNPIDPTKQLDNININDGDLKSPLILKRNGSEKLTNINIGKGNDDLVTVKSGSSAIFAQSDFTITTAMNAGDNVDGLTLAEGIKKVKIIGGRISTISLDATKKIDRDVTIYSEGAVGINAIDYTNMPTTGAGATLADKYNIIYESKYTGANTPVFKTTTVNSKANTIVTAAQLAAAAAGTDYNVVGTFDLGGAEDVEWTSLPDQSKSFKGAKNIRTDNGIKALKNQATIKNLKGENGLIAKWTPATTTGTSDVISNFIFDGTNVVSKTGGTKLGLLVGEVDMSTASVLPATIKNIKLQGTTTIQDEEVGKNAACVAIGGVIGKISGTEKSLQLANIDVNNNTSVYGFKYVGGIIGEVAGKVIFGAQKADGSEDKFANTAAFADNDVYNKSAAKLTTILVASAPASPNLPTVGQFFGGASAIAYDGDVTILGALSKLSSAKESTIEGVDWGYYLPDTNSEYWKWKAYLQYDEIGHFGYSTTANAVTVNPAINKIVNYTKKSDNTYGTSTYLVPYVGTSAPTDNATTKYFGYVIQPY